MVALKGLVTMHPGGWQDIIDFVGDIPAQVAQADYQRSVVFHAAKKNEMITERRLEGNMLTLADLEHGVSGILASQAYQVLLYLGYPVPGDPDWLKPCSQWKSRRK